MTEAAPPVSSAWSQGPALDLAAAARQPVDAVLHELGSTQTGLTSDQAARRLATVGRNVLASHKVTALGVLGRQLRNPLLILLLAAAGVSAATGDPTDGAIIAAIVVLSVGLGDDACSHLPRQQRRTFPLTCGNGARGRIRTDDLPITSRTETFQLDPPSTIAAAQVRG